MDVLPRISRQLLDLIEKMSIPQRIVFSISTLFVLAGFGWVIALNRPEEFRPLAGGKPFATQELASAELALTTAKLTGFRRDGQQLLAPANELEKYDAVVAETNDISSDLGTQILRQYEAMGPFSTDRQRQQMKEALLLQELRLMIKKVPEIEDARVAIASSDRRNGWNQKSRSTANITLKPKPGKEVSANLVSSLRHVVANMVPDLEPSDITIFDVTKGAIYSQAVPPVDIDEPDRDDVSGQSSRSYEQQLRKALAHIRNANVTVRVERPSGPGPVSSQDIDDTWSEPTFDGARIPSDGSNGYETGFRGSETKRDSSTTRQRSEMHSVKVAVTFPRDYVSQIAARRASKGETSRDRLSPDMIEDEVVAQVERIVSRMIPGISTEQSISVTCVDPVLGDSAAEAKDPSLSTFEKQFQQWKWPVVGMTIALFSLMFMFTGRRTNPSAEPVSDPLIDSITTDAVPEMVPLPLPISVTPDRIVQLREEIRTLVESDTSASANILAHWLSERAA